MKKLLLALSCALLLGNVGIRSASADTFSWSFSSGSDSGSGTFVAGLVSPGVYQITSLTGTADGLPLTLLPVGTFPGSGFAANDNLLYFPASIPAIDLGQTTPSLLDVRGVSFTLGSVGNLNVYFGAFNTGDPFVYNLFDSSNTNTPLGSSLGTLTLVNLTPPTTAATPEPGSVILLGTGAMGLIGVVRRRFLVA
jgi:hypothetical protein